MSNCGSLYALGFASYAGAIKFDKAEVGVDAAIHTATLAGSFIAFQATARGYFMEYKSPRLYREGVGSSKEQEMQTQ